MTNQLGFHCNHNVLVIDKDISETECKEISSKKILTKVKNQFENLQPDFKNFIHYIRTKTALFEKCRFSCECFYCNERNTQ